MSGESQSKPSGPASGGAGPASATGATKIERKQLLILLVLSLSLAIIVIDATIVIVAQYQIQKDFGISLKDLEWITSLYALSILTTTFTGKARSVAFGIWGATAGAAAVLGPVLGGYFTSDPTLTWRWAFFINIPIGITALVG